ncbi:MAG: AIM24 family protein [Verrucomicrobiae bacterium]|nr:AIM24 family protein [Verrucomicrobiae bacterium]
MDTPPPIPSDSDLARYSLKQFVEETEQRDRGQGLFELETQRLLEVNLNGTVWTKMGSMVAYRGNVKFTREGVLEQGIGNLLKKAVSGEGTRLTKAEGQGKVYLADSGKKVIIIGLENEAIVVNGNDVLAFETSIKNTIKMMRKITAMMAGGLFNVRLEGTGLIAITSHYDPMTLRVTPNNPVITDPNATIAWSGNLEPAFKKDVSLKTFVGRGSGESIQMEFKGEGFVVVQPYEEVVYQHAGG